MEGTNTLPSNFEFKDIKITSVSGSVWDITDLIQEVEVVESIYTISCLYTFTVVDSSDMFGYLKLSGNEKLSFTLLKRNGTEVEIYNRECYVVDFPVYTRSNTHVQSYKISAVSKQLYLGNIIRVSRKFYGSIAGAIKNIFEGDLKTKVDVYNTHSSGNIKGIIPNLTLSKTINWLIRRAFDEKSYPIFVYETLFNGVHIESLSNMITNEIEGRYRQDSYFIHEQRVENDDTFYIEDYNQKKYRILDFSSDLGLSKLNNSMKGVYGSNTLEIDISTKQHKLHKFQYKQDDVIYPHSLYDSNFLLDNKELNSYVNAKTHTVIKNEKLFTEYNEYNEKTAQVFGKLNSVKHNIDTMTHNMVLNGDVNLYPGRIIDILLRRAIDPSIDDLGSIDASTMNDEYLSGKYLIVSNIHTFKDMKHISNIKVVRDSTPVKLGTRR